MDPDKKDPNIRCFLFYSHKKKYCWCTQNYCETYGENVIAIRTCECWFKRWFKNSDFNISGKERSGRPAAVEEDELMEGWEKLVENDGKYFD